MLSCLPLPITTAALGRKEESLFTAIPCNSGDMSVKSGTSITYHITNVNSNGTIPADEQENWLTPGLNNFRVNGFYDSDQDGVPDAEDSCPESNLEDTVIIDDCDTGVTNEIVAEGCTMSDLIAQCAEGAKNHGKFVSCVAHLTNDWMKAGLISGKEKGKIQKCAAQADIP